MAFYFVVILAFYILTLVIKNRFIFLRLLLLNLFWWLSFSVAFLLFAVVPKLYNLLQQDKTQLYFHIGLASFAFFIFIVNVLIIALARR